MSKLQIDESIYLPTCCLPKAGRPKKKRYIGSREKAVNKAKAKHARSLRKGKTESERNNKEKVSLEVKLDSVGCGKMSSIISTRFGSGRTIKMKGKVKVSRQRPSLKKVKRIRVRASRSRKRKLINRRDNPKKVKKYSPSKKKRKLRSSKVVKNNSKRLKSRNRRTR